MHRLNQILLAILLLTGCSTLPAKRDAPVATAVATPVVATPVLVQDGATSTKATVTGSNALKVDGSAVTQPISAASLPLPTGAATSANQDGIIRDGTGDTTQANVTSGRLNTDVTGTVTANAGTNLNTSALALESGGNLANVGNATNANDSALSRVMAQGCQFDDTSPGTTTENNVRAVRCSTRREVYTQIRDAAGNERGANVNASNELQTSAAVTSFPDNEPFNVAQFGGSAVATGTGASGSGIPRVTVSNDSAMRIRDNAGNEIPSATTRPLDADRGLVVRQPIACGSVIAISQTADTQVITGTSGQRVYFCAILINANAAETWNLIEGSGSVCATSPTAIIGSTTEGNGVASAANGGFAMATSQPFMRTGVDGNNVCLTQVGANRITGVISYGVHPND